MQNSFPSLSLYKQELRLYEGNCHVLGQHMAKGPTSLCWQMRFLQPHPNSRSSWPSLQHWAWHTGHEGCWVWAKTHCFSLSQAPKRSQLFPGTKAALLNGVTLAFVNGKLALGPVRQLTGGNKTSVLDGKSHVMPGTPTCRGVSHLNMENCADIYVWKWSQ